MILITGGLMFGIIIGYLSWYAIMPGVRRVTLNTITAFIAIVTGAAITTLFPAGTEIFGGYAFGLAIGFFMPPAYRVLNKERIRWHKKIEEAKKQFEIEKSEIDQHWSEYEQRMRIVGDKFLEKPPYWIRISDIPFPYSKEGRIYIMKKFAQVSDVWYYDGFEKFLCRKNK